MQRDQPPHCGNHTSRQPLPSVQQQAGFAKPHQLLVFLSIVLGIGFFATSVASFYASKASIRDSIVNNELPLTTDNIYSEIQKDLVRPVFISAMMASDTFLRDWVLAGEKTQQQFINIYMMYKINPAHLPVFLCLTKPSVITTAMATAKPSFQIIQMMIGILKYVSSNSCTN